jgi:alanine racemase
MSTAPEELELLRPTVVSVDLEAFRRNLRAIRALLPGGSRLVAVLKADGYGHGALPLAQICDEEEVAMIAVALFEEALELHASGIQTPLLVLGPMQSAQIDEAMARQFSIGVVGPEELEAVVARSNSSQQRAKVHLKLDSGMGRMGIVKDDLPHDIELLRSAAQLEIEAIYTHFANASDPDDPFTDVQLENFRSMLELLSAAGIEAPLHHSANSAATMRRLVNAGEWARAGIALYGGEALDKGVSRLEPLMRWTTRIARLKTIEAGDAVGYGTTFKASRRTQVATLPVGYADGYDRLLSNRASVLLRGRRVPLIGRVSMDLITIDVTDVEGVSVGDEVVLLGRDGEEEIAAEELAAMIGTISYEIFCGVSARVPRVYHDGAKRVAIRSKFVQALKG